MPKTYQVLDTVEQVCKVLPYPAFAVFARVAGRQDWAIYDETGVQMRDGVLFVNFGEYHYEKGYLNQEWLKPDMVYMKHQCDGCHYPPSMCCLQVSDFRSFDEYDRLGYLKNWAPDDSEIIESEAYQKAEDELWRAPVDVNPRLMELES